MTRRPAALLRSDAHLMTSDGRDRCGQSRRSPRSRTRDDDRSRRAAGQVPRGARQAAAARRQRPVPRADGPVRARARRSVRRARSSASRCSTRSTVALIGGGFVGLVTGARLKQAGIDDVRIIEGGGDFGGTWYWNRYPGAMCDTAAMIYLPLLEETGHMPSAEVRASRPRSSSTASASPSSSASTTTRCSPPRSPSSSGTTTASRWIIRTDRGDEFRARFVAMGTGPLHRPKLPGIPGIETFAGHCFHTSRWDYDVHRRRLDRRADDRASPTSASASSAPARPRCSASRTLARDARRAVRVPAHAVVDRRAQQPRRSTPSGSRRSSPAGSSEWLMNFATLQTGGFADEDLVKDGWTDISQRIRDRIVAKVADGDGVRRPSCVPARPSRTATTRRWRRSAPASTPSSPTRRPPRRSSRGTASCASGRASTTSTCRRTTSRTCHLVDTDGKGVERIDETGVWVGGRALRARLPDLRVGLRGRHRATPAARATTPIGRDGVTLSEHWADGMRSLHGIHVHGFPNLFIVGFAQGANLISNVTRNLAESGTTIAAVVAHALDDRRRRGGGHRAEAEAGVDGPAREQPARRSSATPTARPATTTTRASR